jgi:hypothetical protein
MFFIFLLQKNKNKNCCEGSFSLLYRYLAKTTYISKCFLFENISNIYFLKNIFDISTSK